MDNIRRFLGSRGFSILLFAVAVILLLAGSIGGTRAALTVFSEDYVGEVETKHLGLTVIENGVAVDEDLGILSDLPDGEAFQIGRKYSEALMIRNDGTTEEYVRVIVYRYWTDAEGNKDRTLDPSFIHLEFDNSEDWIRDTSDISNTAERLILYYSRPLAPEEATSTFCSMFSIDGRVAYMVSQKTEKTDGDHINVTNTYDYDGRTFVIEIIADGVQTHSAENAVRSAWGIDVSVSEDGRLTLKEG